MFPLRANAIALSVLVCVTGCGGPSEPPPSSETPAGPTPVPPADATAPPSVPEPITEIVVLVGDAELTRIPLDALGESVTLGSFLPPESPPVDSWKLFETSGPRGEMFLESPATRYSDQRLELWTRPDGRHAVGLRRPWNPELPERVRGAARRPTAQLLEPSRIVIHTRLPAAVVADRQPVRFRVSGRGAFEATEEQLASLRVREHPGNARKPSWWALRDVVAVAAPEQDVVAILLHGGDEPRRYTPEQLAVDPPVHLIKINRKGLLKFRAWAPAGDDPGVAAEIERVTLIEIETRSSPD